MPTGRSTGRSGASGTPPATPVFCLGERAQARLNYGSVLELNPSYKPAEQAIAEINKLEQRENELFTPQGRTLDKEKRRQVLKEIVGTLRLVRDIVTLGR